MIVQANIINLVPDGESIISKSILKTEAIETGWTRECSGIKRVPDLEDNL